MTVADYLRVSFWMGQHGVGPVERGPEIAPRYMDVHACAAYIGRSARAIYDLVYDNQIPHHKVGKKLQFDKERVDSWMSRHSRRGKMV